MKTGKGQREMVRDQSRWAVRKQGAYTKSGLEDMSAHN